MQIRRTKREREGVHVLGFEGWGYSSKEEYATRHRSEYGGVLTIFFGCYIVMSCHYVSTWPRGELSVLFV